MTNLYTDLAPGTIAGTDKPKTGETDLSRYYSHTWMQINDTT
jgi:hypothetical protein